MAEDSMLQELLPEPPKRFPAQTNVLRGRTLTKTGQWWKAVLLVKTQSYGKEGYQLRLYGWQWSNKEKKWKTRQKFNISAAAYLGEVVYILQSFLSRADIRPPSQKEIERLLLQNRMLVKQLEDSKKRANELFIRALERKKEFIDTQSSKISQLKDTLSEFKQMLNNNETETKIHNFLKKPDRAWIFGPNYQRVVHKTKLTVLTECDVLLQRHDSFYDVLELKGPSETLFTKVGSRWCWSPALSKGVSQIMLYLSKARTQYSTIKEESSTEGTSTPLDVFLPKGILVIGRRKPEETKLLKIHNEFLSKVEVRTYDDLVDTAEQSIKVFSQVE